MISGVEMEYVYQPKGHPTSKDKELCTYLRIQVLK
jgi:hypothetical protein